jgi:hypothetical protein
MCCVDCYFIWTNKASLIPPLFIVPSHENWRLCFFDDIIVTFTGACANEIIPSINRSFVYKAKEGRHVRMKKKIPHCRNSFKIQEKNHRKMQKRYYHQKNTIANFHGLVQ